MRSKDARDMAVNHVHASVTNDATRTQESGSGWEHALCAAVKLEIG